MSNRNYEVGRRFEYETKKWYENLGYHVIRAAGSHGKFDLVAIKENDFVDLIQCKVVGDDASAVRLVKEFEANPPLPQGRYVQTIVVKVKRGKTWRGMVLMKA